MPHQGTHPGNPSPHSKHTRGNRHFRVERLLMAALLLLLVGALATASYLVWDHYRWASSGRGAPPHAAAPTAPGPPPELPAPPPAPSPETLHTFQRHLALFPAPRQDAPRHTTDDLIAAVDQAFAAPADELKPAVVILPVVDGTGKARPDGVVLGQMALLAATYTPHRRLALSVGYLQHELATGGYLKTGSVLEPGTIAQCTASLGTPLYVLPRLDAHDGKHDLTVECHGDGQAHPDRAVHHDVPAGGLRTVPGLVAHDVLDWLGVPLDADALRLVTEPQVRTDQELDYLNRLLLVYPATPAEDEWLRSFLQANPRCAYAWEQYLGQGPDPGFRVTEWAAAGPGCDDLQILADRLRREDGHAEEALLDLLKLAPSHRGDTGYHATLTRCAIALDDERLADHLLGVWARADPGYAGGLERGALLTEWGWKARGEGWADTVTEEGWRLFHERLNRARDELEAAVRHNPAGARAHVGLMRVARALGLPREYLEDHFRQAVRAQPHLLPPYSEKWEYLRPRWHGDADELLTFGKECLDTGDWDNDIPGLCLSALREVAAELPDDVLRRALAAGPLWDLVQAYHAAVANNGPPAARDTDTSFFARMGVIGGHWDEVVPACRTLQEKGYADWTIFVDHYEYQYFLELVQAHTGKLPPRLNGQPADRALARAGAALADGDLDRAEKELAQVGGGDPHSDRLVERYRGAVALGRRLQADGRVALTPQQVQDLCIIPPGPSCSVQGEELVVRPFDSLDLLFPLGLRNVVVSGTLALEGRFSQVELQVHTRSPLHKVRLAYFPDRHSVHLWRDRVDLRAAAYGPGPHPFRLELGAEEDRLEPAEGVAWPVPVSEDLPGGFALRVWGASQGATVTLRDLRIEQRK